MRAAEPTGKTIGQYLDEDVGRFRFAQSQLTQTRLPYAPVDMQNQVENLTKIVEGITTRLAEQDKQSVWQRLVGN